MLAFGSLADRIAPYGPRSKDQRRMIHERLASFPIAEDLVLLNHASFGVMTNEVLELAEHTRRELEADSLALVDVDAIAPRLREAARVASSQLELSPEGVTLTHNATAGGAALMRSLPLGEGDQVVVLSTEYDSIVRGWQVRCGETGARFVRLAVPIPLQSTSQLLSALEDGVQGPVAIAQMSLVTSSTAVTLPVEEVADWFRRRGARVLLDIAHGPGHVDLDPARWKVSAMFGTLHKWYPTPRPVGVLWLDEELREFVRPAEVSLTWDSPDLVERFSWPGTFDPTPRLCVPRAIGQWNEWERRGDLARCEQLADYATERLATIGTATCSDGLMPPRLRAVTIACPRAGARDALEREGIRGWTGTGPNGETTLRVATHVYNEESDVDRLCDAIKGCL